MDKEEIIKEIREGSEVGKQILGIEIDYYKNLAKEPEKKEEEKDEKK